MPLTDILSYLFKFKLSFVRELVLFEKWYQEASHTQCLQGSVVNLGLLPRFSTPRASPSVFNTSLNLLSHTQCLQGSVENRRRIENRGLCPRFSTPRASPSVFNTSLNLLTVIVN